MFTCIKHIKNIEDISSRIFEECARIILSLLIVVILITIAWAVLNTLLELRAMFSNDIHNALKQVMINSLTILALLEVFRTALAYFSEGRVKVTYIIDTVLVVILTEVMVFWFKDIEYSKVLMEQKIVGRELTVAILGKRALPVIEIKSKRQFYDYRAKYEKGFTDYLVPAPLPPALTKQVKWIALRVHRCLGLRDFSRVDMIVDPSGRPYVLEVNSIPGFTETSLLPKAADSAGLNFTDLCVYLLKTAYERTQKKF